METIKVYRFEHKYYLSKIEEEVLLRKVRAVLKSDEHAINNSYFVRSLYFDTNNNCDYHSKIIGEETRKKVRLRIYDPKTKHVKLEIKNKFGIHMLKETTTISKECALELMKGNYETLLKYDNEVCNKVYYLFKRDNYKPNCIIDYHRNAFKGPVNQIRVTFDNDIRVIKDTSKFFEDITGTSVMYQDVPVLEVKYNESLPSYIQSILPRVGVMNSSISKYCLGVER